MSTIETIYSLLKVSDDLKSALNNFQNLPLEAKLKDLKDRGSPRYFYKYMSNLGHIKPLIEDGAMYLSSRTQFNDPFDTFARFTESTNSLGHQMRFRSISRQRGEEPSRQQMEYFKSNGAEMIKRSFFKTMNSCGLYCLSEDPSNILMWGHYSNNHKGLVIEFDQIMDFQTFGVAQKVNYTNQLPLYKANSKGAEQIAQIVTNKYEAWSYEREWRIFSPNTAGKYYFFDVKSISKIIFGALADSEFMQAVTTMVEQANKKFHGKIKTTQATLSETEYKVIID